MLFRNIVYRLGRDPKKSWSTFKLGLAIFSAGATLILLGAQFNHLLQIPGFMTLFVGILLSAKGYIGIFANRFAKTIERLDAASSLNNKSNRPN